MRSRFDSDGSELEACGTSRLPVGPRTGFFRPMTTLRSHAATRYVEPLREGGSLPAVVDTDGGLFVVKFRGAGQGARALVAEVLVGELAREMGLPVPGLVAVEVDPVFGRTEPDPEIQDLLRASHGTNIGIEYLEGAFNFDATAAGEFVPPEMAAEIVWLDAFVTNPDRTARNPNLMVHERRPWLIDHGAALYHHHDWSRVTEARIAAPFPLVRDHVLLGVAGDVGEADDRISARIDGGVFGSIVDRVPPALLEEGDRERYLEWFGGRWEARSAVVDGVRTTAAEVRSRPPARRSARR